MSDSVLTYSGDLNGNSISITFPSDNTFSEQTSNKRSVICLWLHITEILLV